ncbi:SDR family NAD(P)-dependent oxidoreductase [Streptomyces sp. AK08-02]|uniref:SDR family NAD(P)-dependent oxidoreductase n=1 Tax=Streptomyces sp. AK08-02 TaxID=3028654 RepID=UPI0029A35EBD|nr:SDR family NAD(P)-dependent oxidoreductase [Streptomyces sp. AK08-02]MDX3748180.1 SDR family NAD(P)-dependent oxidoreductase [Streptomyces sp. AK08-02]
MQLERGATSRATGPAVMVVAGGTGNIGEGIVRAGLRSGATVVVPSRGPSRLDDLRRYVAEFGVDDTKLDTRVTDVGDFRQAYELLAQVTADHGRVDLTVGSLGGYWSGPALLQTEEGCR